MTPKAAEELLAAIEPEDHFTRRRLLDAWTRRWVAVMDLTDTMPEAQRMVIEATFGEQRLNQICHERLSWRMMQGLVDDEVHATQFSQDQNGNRVLRMHVLLQEPKEPEPQTVVT